MPNRPIPACGPCTPPTGAKFPDEPWRGEPPAGSLSRFATHRCCGCGELVRLVPDLQRLVEVSGTCVCGWETTFSRLDSHLAIWTVCESPRDLPGLFTARLHLVVGGRSLPTAKSLTAASLEATRALLPKGLTRLPRDPKDDPVIVESWI